MNILGFGGITHERRTEKTFEHGELLRIPKLDRRMPTRLGNILRFAELRPKDKYGLDMFVCFPRLWTLPPPDARKDLAYARSDLDATLFYL